MLSKRAQRSIESEIARLEKRISRLADEVHNTNDLINEHREQVAGLKALLEPKAE